MSLAHYLKLKKHRFSVTRLSEVSLYSRDTLYRWFQNGPEKIEQLIETHKDELNER